MAIPLAAVNFSLKIRKEGFSIVSLSQAIIIFELLQLFNQNNPFKGQLSEAHQGLQQLKFFKGKSRLPRAIDKIDETENGFLYPEGDSYQAFISIPGRLSISGLNLGSSWLLMMINILVSFSRQAANSFTFS